MSVMSNHENVIYPRTLPQSLADTLVPPVTNSLFTNTSSIASDSTVHSNPPQQVSIHSNLLFISLILDIA